MSQVNAVMPGPGLCSTWALWSAGPLTGAARAVEGVRLPHSREPKPRLLLPRPGLTVYLHPLPGK